MRTQLLFQSYKTRILAIAMIVLSGCSRDTSPTVSGKTAESVPASPTKSQDHASPLPGQAAETGKNDSVSTTPQSHEVTTVELPAPMDDVCGGAGGRLLVLRLKKLAKLAVVDVAIGNIVGYIPLDDQDDVFAAGADKLVVINRRSRVAKRFSLPDLKREAELVMPGESPIVAAGMGASSHGPLYLVCPISPKEPVVAIDPETLLPADCPITLPHHSANFDAYTRINVSTDGSTFCVWNERQTSHSVLLATHMADQIVGCIQNTVFHYVCPDDIGQRIYTGATLLSTPWEPTDGNELPQAVQAIPAIGGPYYLTVPVERRRGRPPRVTTPPQPQEPSPASASEAHVYLLGQSRPVASLPTDTFALLTDENGQFRAFGAICRRLFLLPAARTIAELPNTSNAVILHRLDLDEELRRTFPDGLVVVSRPPRTVRLGETLRYQIRTQSKSGNPAFHLDTGPEGMAVSENGLLEWTPSARMVSTTTGAVISIKDSGQTKLHAISVAVQPPPDVFASAIKGPPPSVLTSGKPIGDIRLKLPAAFDDVCVGGDGRFLVFTLPSLQKIAVFDVSAAKIVGYVPASGKCLLAAGMDKLVVVSPKRSVIERFDLQTQKLEATQTLSLQGTAYDVAMGAASRGPVLIVVGSRDAPPKVGNPNVLSQVAILNLDTLKAINCKMPEVRASALILNPVSSRACASADGRVFGILGDNVHYIMNFTGNELTRQNAIGFSTWMLPDQYGDHIYSMRGFWADGAWRGCPTSQDDPRLRGFVPALSGSLFLRLTCDTDRNNASENARISAGVCVAGEDKPLVTLRGIPLFSDILNGGTRTERIILDRQIFLIPKEKRLVLLPEGKERIVLRRFDLDEELARPGGNYLAVVSCPPQVVTPGQTFQYQMDVRSNTGKVEYRLDSGPKGMQISKTGLVRWDVKEPPEEPTAGVSITVTDRSGKSVQHSFELTTSRESRRTESSTNAPGATAQRMPTRTPIVFTPPVVSRRDSGEGMVFDKILSKSAGNVGATTGTDTGPKPQVDVVSSRQASGRALGRWDDGPKGP